MSNTAATIAIHLATPADARAIARLAALDGAEVPTLPALLVTVDGEPRAALSLTTGAVVADPFAPTADLVELLRMRAALLRGEARRHRNPLAGRAPARLAA